MFDVPVTIVGNVLTAPEWRRVGATNALVANFKVASTTRRYDRDSGRWVDGPSLRVRVNCWRRLAEGVAASVMVGDPVIVTGRLYTRDWLADDGQRRLSYELEAGAVGHDLARGQGSFRRHRGSTGTSAVEDAQADARVHGETATRAGGSTVTETFGAGEYGPAFGDDLSAAALGSYGASHHAAASCLPADDLQADGDEPGADDDLATEAPPAPAEPSGSDPGGEPADPEVTAEAAAIVEGPSARTGRGRSRIPVGV